jgi:hypothetical protein
MLRRIYRMPHYLVVHQSMGTIIEVITNKKYYVKFCVTFKKFKEKSTSISTNTVFKFSVASILMLARDRFRNFFKGKISGRNSRGLPNSLKT